MMIHHGRNVKKKHQPNLNPRNSNILQFFSQPIGVQCPSKTPVKNGKISRTRARNPSGDKPKEAAAVTAAKATHGLEV